VGNLHAHLCGMVDFHPRSCAFYRWDQQFHSLICREEWRSSTSSISAWWHAECQKIRKLDFVGPKDSCKTSLAAIFHRIMLADKIVSVTSDEQWRGFNSCT
jgi:hypothetical protein